MKSWDRVEMAGGGCLPHAGRRPWGQNRKALAAQASSIYRGAIALDRIKAQTLVLAGDADPLAIRPEVLSGAIPGATLQILSGGSHRRHRRPPLHGVDRPFSRLR